MRLGLSLPPANPKARLSQSNPNSSIEPIRELLNIHVEPTEALIRLVELIVQPDAHDVVGEMGVRGGAKRRLLAGQLKDTFA